MLFWEVSCQDYLPKPSAKERAQFDIGFGLVHVTFARSIINFREEP